MLKYRQANTYWIAPHIFNSLVIVYWKLRIYFLVVFSILHLHTSVRIVPFTPVSGNRPTWCPKWGKWRPKWSKSWNVIGRKPVFSRKDVISKTFSANGGSHNIGLFDPNKSAWSWLKAMLTGSLKPCTTPAAREIPVWPGLRIYKLWCTKSGHSYLHAPAGCRSNLSWWLHVQFQSRRRWHKLLLLQTPCSCPRGSAHSSGLESPAQLGSTTLFPVPVPCSCQWGTAYIWSSIQLRALPWFPVPVLSKFLYVSVQMGAAPSKCSLLLACNPQLVPDLQVGPWSRRHWCLVCASTCNPPVRTLLVPVLVPDQVDSDPSPRPTLQSSGHHPTSSMSLLRALPCWLPPFSIGCFLIMDPLVGSALILPPRCPSGCCLLPRFLDWLLKKLPWLLDSSSMFLSKRALPHL